MSFRVEYSLHASNELVEAYRWIKERAPMAAEKWREELIGKVNELADSPTHCDKRRAPNCGYISLATRRPRRAMSVGKIDKMELQYFAQLITTPLPAH